MRDTAHARTVDDRALWHHRRRMAWTRIDSIV
jgi:hypothetical protein